jgi:hypothetical protein
MLPCATTVVIGIIDDSSGSVPRISLAWRRRKRFGLCPTGGFLANGPVVPSTRLSDGQNGICRDLRISVSIRVCIRGASKTGDVRLCRDGQVSCKFRQTREEVGQWLDRNERGFPTRKFVTSPHEHLAANNYGIHFLCRNASSSGTHTWVYAISLICRDSRGDRRFAAACLHGA